MWAFVFPTAEPLLLMMFGFVFLVVATGLKVRLAKKYEAEEHNLELLNAEPNPLRGQQ